MLPKYGVEAELTGMFSPTWIELGKLLALAGDAVADEVVPVSRGSGSRWWRRSRGPDRPALPSAEMPKKSCALGAPSCGDGVADGEAQWRVGGDVVAEVGRAGGGVIAVQRQRVGGVEAGEGSVVVEAVVRSADGDFVAVGVEVAGVAGVVEDGAKGSCRAEWRS